MAEIFISYKSERRPAVQYLARVLENYGYTVWFDYGLLSGQEFAPQIEREIRAARAVVVLWCNLSINSHWVREEALLAAGLKTLIPARVDKSDLPFGFGSLDTIDLSKWDGNPRSGAALDRLLEQIAIKVGRDPAPSFRALSDQETNWRVHRKGLEAFPLDEEAENLEKERGEQRRTESGEQVRQVGATANRANVEQPVADAEQAKKRLAPRIAILGVGGAGGNTVSKLANSGLTDVELIVANTDEIALRKAVAGQRIQLGPELAHGLGAGMRTEIGRAAAEASAAEIESAIDGVDLVFLVAGMGGGTGTGAAPVIGKIARSKGILTVGFVTTPFRFEGTRRIHTAERGINDLKHHVDMLIVIPNQNLFLIANADTTFSQAFALADEVLERAVASIVDLTANPGKGALDFADIRSMISKMGVSMMGTGEAEGDNRALTAAAKALGNPLLGDFAIQDGKMAAILISGGEDLTAYEVEEISQFFQVSLAENAVTAVGSVIQPAFNGKIRVTVFIGGA